MAVNFGKALQKEQFKCLKDFQTEIDRGEVIFLKGKILDMYSLFREYTSLHGLIKDCLEYLALNDNINYHKMSFDDLNSFYTLIHSILLLNGFDEYYDTIIYLDQSFNKSHRSRWLIATPLINQTKTYISKINNINDKDYQNLRYEYMLCYSRLCTDWCLVPDISFYKILMNDISNIPNDKFLNMSTLDRLCIALYQLGPNNTEYTMNYYLNYKRKLCNKIEACIKPQLHHSNSLDNKKIIIIMDNTGKVSSDYKGAQVFIETFKELGYSIDALTTKDPIDNDMFDSIYSIQSFDQDNLNTLLSLHMKYQFAFYITQLFALGIVSSIIRLAKVQIGMLGHLISSGTPSMDYFIRPIWDNEDNYSESAIHLPGMACTIPTVLPVDYLNIKKKTDRVYIFCPLTGSKINNQTGKRLQQINKVVGNEDHLYLIAMGYRPSGNLCTSALNYIHFNPFISNYEYTYSNKDHYEGLVQNCDLALFAFPYTPYISVIDAIRYCIPIVVQCDTYKNSSQCAAKILEIMGLQELITYSTDEYCQLAKKMIQDEEYRNSIKQKMKTINYNAIIDKHNQELKAAFKSRIEEFSTI